MWPAARPSDQPFSLDDLMSLGLHALFVHALHHPFALTCLPAKSAQPPIASPALPWYSEQLLHIWPAANFGNFLTLARLASSTYPRAIACGSFSSTLACACAPTTNPRPVVAAVMSNERRERVIGFPTGGCMNVSEERGRSGSLPRYLD